MQTFFDETIEKAANLTSEERRNLIQLLQEQEIDKQREEREKKSKGKIKKGYVSPNTIWVKENSHKYRGLHVALKDGVLIATGKTIKEADLAAKAKGCKNPLLHYIMPEGELPWGGW